MFEITIKGELKEDTALVLTVQERQVDNRTSIQMNACDIDEIVSVIEKRLIARLENENHLQ